MPDIPRRFGPYEILAPLGAGAMGQVYRARDSRLQRDVAVKILSSSGALSPDRQWRFAQEAVAASALNHPNILTVYDVGIEGDIPYLVAELIEGESLRSEMQQGRLSLRRALDVAHQVASGLAAAHEAGIQHRDLKPENVMITRDRRAKIVDFGLARAASDEAEVPPGASAQTQTAAGLIVGTVPYMSPEQARGGRGDFRSDQFALGVMLFEMTTAVHPFRRDTSVQTLSAIITDDPPDMTTLSPLPAPVRWLIRRLLAKDPRERYASTTDLAVDLRVLRDSLAEISPALESRGEAPRRRWLPVASAAALVAATAFVAGQAIASGGDGPSFDRYTPLATDAGYQGSPAWSPDGKTLAYVAEINGVVQVFTRRLESQLRTQITSSIFDCHDPFWSPDGTRIYYHSPARDRDALWYVSPVGGAPELVIEGATMSAISPDGKTIATLREESTATVSTGLWVSSPPGAEPQRYAQGVLKDLTFSNGVLRFAPDGSKLMAWLWRDAADVGPNTRFWEIPLPTGEPRERLNSITGLRIGYFSWLRDNRHIVLVRSDGPTPGTHLWVADTRSDRAWPLTATAGNESAPDVSPDGQTVAFTSEATDFDIVEVPLDGSALRPFLSSTRNEFDPAFSPTSTQYAFVTDRTGSLQIWIRNEEGYLQQPLVTDQMFGGVTSSIGSLAFSPDGQRLAFQRFDSDSAARYGGPRIWFASIAGGTPVALGGEAGYQDAPTWSPDGEWIAYIAGKIGEWSLVKSRIGAGNAPATVLKTGIPPYIARPQWSPDGKWIVCETMDGLTIVSADGKQSSIVAGPEWMAYAWSADSRAIYGLHATDDLHHFMFVSLDVESGKERVIHPNMGILPPANQPIRGLTRLRDRGFLTSVARVRSDIYLIDGLQPPRTWWQRLWPFTGRRR